VRAEQIAIACILGCGAAMPAPQAVPDSSIVLTATSLGPLSAKTPANLVALRQIFAGYDVVPVNVDTAPDRRALEYQVFEHGKLMFVIVPSSEGAILNVHVNTPKVSVTGHPWRVGAPFAGASELTTCECWGNKPACFKKGEHVAVTFERSCKGTADARSRRALEGIPIKRLVWKPEAFGGAAYGGSQYGGAVEPEPEDPQGP
jgi:hypothetical protein